MRIRSNKGIRRRILWVLVGMLLALTACGSSMEEQDPMKKHVEEIYSLPLEQFHARKLDGEEYTNEKLSERSLVIIYFWATWSSVSQYRLKQLAACKKELPSDVLLITACVDGDIHKKAAREVLSESGYKGATLISGDNDYYTLVNAIQYLPTVVFFDGEGKQIKEPVIGIDGKLVRTIRELTDIYSREDTGGNSGNDSDEDFSIDSESDSDSEEESGGYQDEKSEKSESGDSKENSVENSGEDDAETNDGDDY